MTPAIVRWRGGLISQANITAGSTLAPAPAMFSYSLHVFLCSEKAEVSGIKQSTKGL